MFLARCVWGENSGKYYGGYANFSPVWCDLDNAKRLDISDAHSIICCFIDQRCEVLVAERLPETTDEDCQKLALSLANDFFQGPSKEITGLLYKTIRKDNFAPIHKGDFNKTSKSTDGYMSVWEWLHKAFIANDSKID